VITKNMFCEITIDEFLSRENKNRDQLVDIDSYRSTSVGLAMRHLGLISDCFVLKYLQTRSGIFKIYSNPIQVGILTFDEMLSLLPDELEESHQEISNWNRNIIMKDCRECEYWRKNRCIDPIQWVDENLDKCCRHKLGAQPVMVIPVDNDD